MLESWTEGACISTDANGVVVAHLDEEVALLHETRSKLLTLPQINMEAHRGPNTKDSSLKKGPSPLPC